MPYADNLYSADDSDVESFSDELSPADGYFSNREPSRHALVPDPSLETRNDVANSKAQEAREEAEANPERRLTNPETSREQHTSSPLNISTHVPSTSYSTRSPMFYTSHSPTTSRRQQDDLYSETSPLLHSTAPPPAYSPANPHTETQQFNRNYSTIPSNQLEGGIREPESMGEPHESDERSPLWMKHMARASRRRLLRNILLIALVFNLAVGFIIAAVKTGESKKNMRDSPSNKSPSVRPGNGHGPYCQAATINRREASPTYDFKPGKDLSVLQVKEGKNSGRDRARISTSGEIILRRLPEDIEDQETGHITFDVWLSDLEIDYTIEMDGEAQALKVTTPESADLTVSGDHCLSLEITVWIPPKASFGNTHIEATQLTLRVLDDVEVQVSGQAGFSTYGGNVIFPVINESTVRGLETFNLPGQKEIQQEVRREGLSDETSPTMRELSPSISDLSPEAGLKARKDSSSLGTCSGFCSREILVATSSGDIKGSFCLMDLLKCETISGDIDISVAPQPAADKDPKPAQLILSTSSGDISARLPIWTPAAIPRRDYRTSVNSHSGTVRGDFVIGSDAGFKTLSGDVKIFALPTTFEKSELRTHTVSGSTKASVLEALSDSARIEFIDVGNDDPYLLGTPEAPLDDSDPPPAGLASKFSSYPLSRLTSSHVSSSGDIKIHYPSSWEGEITAQAVSGRVRVGGDGVHIIHSSSKNWVPHEVVARKGSNAAHSSTINVHGISGSLGVWVGEPCLDASWCRMATA